MPASTARPYRDAHDWTRLTTFLAACRVEIAQTHYLHTGDLVWQVFHMLAEFSPSDLLHLWEDPQGNLLGFVLVYPAFGFFDMQVRPDQRGTAVEVEMVAWVHAFFQTRRQTSSPGALYTLVNEHDQHRHTLLAQHGYQRGDAWLYLQRALRAPLPAVPLAGGFEVRSVAGEHEAAERATVLAAAYDAPVQVDRYRQFMHAPGYVPDLDVVAVAPDGRFGAFAMGWVDAHTRVGQFEPVGTAPSMRRRGLGAAVLTEGARRMQAQGAETVIVVVEAAAQAAVALYRSVGLLPSWKLYLYSTTP